MHILEKPDSFFKKIESQMLKELQVLIASCIIIIFLKEICTMY